MPPVHIQVHGDEWPLHHMNVKHVGAYKTWTGMKNILWLCCYWSWYKLTFCGDIAKWPFFTTLRWCRSRTERNMNNVLHCLVTATYTLELWQVNNAWKPDVWKLESRDTNMVQLVPFSWNGWLMPLFMHKQFYFVDKMHLHTVNGVCKMITE